MTKNQNKPKKNKQKKAKAADDGVVAAAPAALQYQGLRSWQRVSKKEVTGDGIETILVEGCQYISNANLSSQSNGLFPTPVHGTYSVTGAVPLNPRLIGGQLGLYADLYRKYNFEEIRLHYVPVVGTGRDGSVLLAYDPAVIGGTAVSNRNPDDTDGDDPLLGNMFQKAMSLANVATGSVWGTTATAIFNALGGKEGIIKGATMLAERVMRWFSVRKPSSVNPQVVQDMIARWLRTEDLDTYLTNLSNYLTAEVGGDNPPYEIGGAIFGNRDEELREVYDAIARMRATATSELTETCQGTLKALANTFLPGTAQFFNVGYIMMSYKCRFADPFGAGNNIGTGAEEEMPNVYNDPLDTLYPESAPYHPDMTVGDRCAYLDQRFEFVIPDLLQAVLEHTGYPKLTGSIFHISAFEKMLHGKQQINVVLGKYNRLALPKSKLALAAPSKPEKEDDDWHAVTKGSKLFRQSKFVDPASALAEMMEQTDLGTDDQETVRKAIKLLADKDAGQKPTTVITALSNLFSGLKKTPPNKQ